MPRPTPRRAAQRKRPPRPKQTTRFQPIGRPPGTEEPGRAPESEVPPGPPGGGDESYDDLGIPGLPPEIAAKIHGFFTSGREDWKQQAIAYLMTTPWFKQEYAGYAAGYANAMFADPLSGGLAQYRSYKTSVQGYYKQFYGREATGTEIESFISAGYSPERVGQIGQGFTNVQAQQGEWQYLAGAFGAGALTEQEKTAYGEQLAGIDTALGQSVKQKIDTALQKVQRVFQGQLATSALGEASLAKTLQKKPDISA